MRTHQNGDLFIPLASKPYDLFAAGKKIEDLREYTGKRWTEETCKIGRRVTLSRGYGKQNRLYGTVISFRVVKAMALDLEYQTQILEHYSTLDIEIAVIGIELEDVETPMDRIIQSISRLVLSLKEIDVELSGVEFASSQDVDKIELQITSSFCNYYTTPHQNNGMRTLRGMNVLVKPEVRS